MNGFTNGYKWAKESDAYRAGFAAWSAQPGSPYADGTQEAKDFRRGQEDGRRHNEAAEALAIQEESTANAEYAERGGW